jgi:hypothetical protein
MSDVTFEMKQSLARRINEIKNKKILVDLMHIIRATNPELPLTENDRGIFITFNNLTSQTYINIDNYLRKNTTKNDESKTLSLSYVPYMSEELDEPKSKLSNRERALIKKQRYNREIESANAF